MAKKILTVLVLFFALLGPRLWQPLAIQAVNYFEKAGMNGEGMVLLGLAFAFLYYFLLDMIPLLLSLLLWQLGWSLWKRLTAVIAFLAFAGATGYAYFVAGEGVPLLLSLVLWAWNLALQRLIVLEGQPPLTGLVLVPVSTATLEWLRFWPAWPQGELALALVETSVYLGDVTAINLILLSLAGLSALLVLVAAQLQAIYFRNYQAAVESGEERLRWLELRNLQEMHTLVHDLKTPLTTIAGLNSLVGLMTVQDQIRQYSEKISQAVDHASAMVSEILAADKRTSITVGNLVNYIRAHVLPRYTGQSVVFDIEGEERELQVNHIRITRAIINLLENAFEATAGQTEAVIKISTRVNGGWLEFCVEDNGPGIDSEQLQKIWEWGFSTKQQPSGLGLYFVRQVVSQHHGRVELDSRPGQGTRVKIFLPVVQEGAIG